MTYSLVVPADLVSRMYHIRELSGVSIRQQIIRAIEARINGEKMELKRK
jgi:hypothetical protein